MSLSVIPNVNQPAVLRQASQPQSTATTGDPSYWSPLKVKVTISSQDRSKVFFVYDSFLVDKGTFTGASFRSRSFTFGSETGLSGSGSFTPVSHSTQSYRILDAPQSGASTTFNTNPAKIRIIQVNVDVALNQAGTFEVYIEDHEKFIDRTNVGVGCRFDIAIGKTTGAYLDVIHGICKVVNTKRDDTNTMIYIMSGYGSQIIFNERIVTFIRTAVGSNMGSSKLSTIDPSMTAVSLARSLIESQAGIPIKGAPTLKQTGMFTENGLDPRVNTPVPGISLPLVEASQVMNTLADYAGAIWGVENDDVFLRFPTSIHTGVTIKDTVSPLDPANKTSYFIGPWDFFDSIDQQDGFANRIWLKGGTMNATADVQSTSSNGYTSLFDRDIAVQFIPGSPRLKNLAVLVAKIGTGGSSNTQYLMGAVVLDKNGSPTGDKITDLKIPISSIAETPTVVFDMGAIFKPTTVPVAHPVWLILYAKGTDESNTVRWYHDGDTQSPNRYSSTRPIALTSNETRNEPTTSTSGWVTSSTGPIYSHAFFKGVKTLAEASDPQSIARYGLVEAVHSVNWIFDNITLQHFATGVLALLAKPIRKFTMQQVTIPNSFVFLPGQQIYIIDSLSGINAPQSLDAEIQQVRYEFKSPSSASGGRTSAPQNSPGIGGGSHGLGTNYCEILPISYLDFLSSGL